MLRAIDQMAGQADQGQFYYGALLEALYNKAQRAKVQSLKFDDLGNPYGGSNISVSIMIQEQYDELVEKTGHKGKFVYSSRNGIHQKESTSPGTTKESTGTTQQLMITPDMIAMLK